MGLLVVSACSGDDSSGGDGGDNALIPVDAVAAELTDDDELLRVSFAPTSEAEAYLVVPEDGTEQPIRIEQDDCDQDTCGILLDRLSVVGAPAVSVTAISGSASSEPVSADIPDWPAPQLEEPDDDPVTLVVTRLRDGAPVLETETVALEDAESRMSALGDQDDVVAVEADGSVAQLQGQEDDELAGYPDGLATWYQEAFDFASLPDHPRAEGVTVAVIDSGVKVDHEALAAADITAVNVVDPDSDVVPDAHGTAAAALIVGDPDSPAPGIATGAKILAYDVYNGADEATRSDVAQGIVQAVDDGADVINVSLAAPCRRQLGPVHQDCESSALREAVEYAERSGVVVVAGAGNDGDGHSDCQSTFGRGQNEDQWPAKFPTTVAVGGTNRSGERWACSPDKDYVDVLAPASKLKVATLVEGQDLYAVRSGTSYAAPLVSGLVAVVLAHEPELTPDAVRGQLAASVAEDGRLVPGGLLARLGITDVDDHYVIDPTTLRLVLPLDVELAFLPGHEVDSLVEELPGFFPRIPSFEGCIPGIAEIECRHTGRGPPLVGIRVMLYVDADGSVTGWGAMDRIHPMNYQYVSTGDESTSLLWGGWSPRCPAHGDPSGRSSVLTPTMAFYWHVPAIVDGRAEIDGDRADLDITISLGQDATRSEPGQLPPMTINRDTLDDCPAALQWEWDHVNTLLPRTTGDTPPWNGGPDTVCQDMGPGECWLDVQDRRNDLVNHVEDLYQEIVDMAPLDISAEVSLQPPTQHNAGYVDDDELVSLKLTTGT